MLLIPQIALKEGRVIGIDGQPHRESPEDFAARLAEAGIARLQLVDEDSAASEQPAGLLLIERIARRVDGVALQVVSGVREEDHVQAHLDAGAHWLVLGHRAASAPHVLKDLCLEFPGHILVGMKVRDRRLAGDAHSKLSNHELVDLAGHFQSDGVDGLVYQDVDATGVPARLNDANVREIAEAVSVDIFVGGRIDLRDAPDIARALSAAGVAGIIVNGVADLAAARRLVEDAG